MKFPQFVFSPRDVCIHILSAIITYKPPNSSKQTTTTRQFVSFKKATACDTAPCCFANHRGLMLLIVNKDCNELILPL